MGLCIFVVLGTPCFGLLVMSGIPRGFVFWGFSGDPWGYVFCGFWPPEELSIFLRRVFWYFVIFGTPLGFAFSVSRVPRGVLYFVVSNTRWGFVFCGLGHPSGFLYFVFFGTPGGLYLLCVCVCVFGHPVGFVFVNLYIYECIDID